MTSIVIPYATGPTASHWNDTELRFCLRSIERYLKGYGEIFLVGAAPRWLQNVTVIPATDHDKTYYKEWNIFTKVMLACQDERVTEDFLFMNDDHFLLSEFEAGTFPAYYSGYLKDGMNRSDPYRQSIVNTIEWLDNYRLAEFQWISADNGEYFDIHCPIIYNKSRWDNIQVPDWEKKYGYCIKTIYGMHVYRDECEEYPDLKIHGAKSATEIKALVKDRLFFSTNDNCRDGGMEAVLQELYPNKSKYER